MKKLHGFLHHLFVPKNSNNFKPKVLHLNFLTFYLVIALVLSFGVKKINSNQGDVLGFATDINQTTLLELTNDERAKNNLPTLNYNDKLSVAAANKAADMFAKGYWAHFAPDGSTSPWGFITGAGYSYKVAGENLAKNFYFSKAVLTAWMNSPTHRANLLRPEYSDVGFAVVNGNLAGEETTLVVQMFGSPLGGAVPAPSAQKAVQIEPKAAVALNPTDVPVLNPPIIAAVTAVPALGKTTRLAINGQPAVLAKTNTVAPKFNLLPMYFTSTMAFLVFIGVALAMDFYFSKKMKLVRIEGKHLAHIMFVGFVFLGMFIISHGGNIH